MKPWRIASAGTALALLFATTSVGLSDPVSESEPNGSALTANPLAARDVMSAAISPNGDEDFFALGEYNSFWGVIALLDTQSGTVDPPATLVMLRNDGTTELGRDSGSWVNGSGLAFVPFLDEALTHYFRVYEEGGDATIADYTLRLYPTYFTTKPEVEPNDSYGAGTVTAPTMSGTLASLSDRDCFAFYAFGLEDFVFALDSDPNGDGAQYDMVLEVRDSSDAVVVDANHTGTGGTEFLELSPMGDTGTYAYCVRAQSGGGGSTAEYKVGLVRNGWIYLPDYSLSAAWTNPRPGNYARIGDQMTFDMSITNDDAYKIPGSVDSRAFFTEGCMTYVSSNPVATSYSATQVSWAGQKPNGIDPGETYAVSMTLRAHLGCNDHVDQSVYMAYYATGTGLDADYLIWWDVLLPLVMRNAP